MQSDEQIAKIMHDMSDDDGCDVPWGKQLPRYRSQQRRQVRKVLTALAAAGHRIIRPDELDPVTVERCAAIVKSTTREYGAMTVRADVLSSFRSLSPTQPEAKEARDGR